MQDGAPPHFAAAVRNYLNEEFPNAWIGRNGPIPWPARSPDLNPCDYFLWGHMKDIIYQGNLEIRAEAERLIQDTARTITPEMLRAATWGIERRLNMCLQQNGQHFEQFA